QAIRKRDGDGRRCERIPPRVRGTGLAAGLHSSAAVGRAGGTPGSRSARLVSPRVQAGHSGPVPGNGTPEVRGSGAERACGTRARAEAGASRDVGLGETDMTIGMAGASDAHTGSSLILARPTIQWR